jgi:hypothetical protein
MQQNFVAIKWNKEKKNFIKKNISLTSFWIVAQLPDVSVPNGNVPLLSRYRILFEIVSTIDENSNNND